MSVDEVPPPIRLMGRTLSCVCNRDIDTVTALWGGDDTDTLAEALHALYHYAAQAGPPG